MVAYRKSRFHDEKGNRVDFGGLLYVPHALVTAIFRKLFGCRMHQPMLSFRAIKVIDKLLQPDFNCVEFGSGMSTAWFADRCGFLLSVENDKDWCRLVDDMIADKGCTHVRHELRTPDEFGYLDNYDDSFFDFALIDGWDRVGCVQSVIPKIKPGGWVYLDNSDKDMTRPDGDLRQAEAALLDAVRQRGGTTRYFVDFAAGNLFAEQGLLVRL